MGRIKLFDDYINNQLSDAQRSEFDARLKTDEEFADDFKMYLFTVDGICREVHQDNLDFGLAMKRLSKEQLKEIIGKKDVEHPEESVRQGISEIAKTKSFRFRPWMWQVASIAAVVVIAYTVVFKIQKQYQNALYDNIYACAQFDESHTRGTVKFIDITKLDDSELEAKLPEMEKNYQESSDPDELYMTGYPLAMAYIRMHKPQPAVDILTNLVSKLQKDEYYEPEVREMRLIIQMLK